MESVLFFVMFLKGVVVRVEGLKMLLLGCFVDYVVFNDGIRGMVL